MVLSATRHESFKDSEWTRNGERVLTKGRWSAEVCVDEAIAFIETAGDKPFFINLVELAPHQGKSSAHRSFGELYADRTESEQHYLGAVTQMDEQYGRLLDYLDKKGLAESTIVVFSSDNGCEPHLIPWSDRPRLHRRTASRQTLPV